MIEKRKLFYEEARKVVEKTETEGAAAILEGGFNAEVGQPRDAEEELLLGRNGPQKRTKTGEELIEFANREDMWVASTGYKQKEKGTWWHPKYNSAHQIDHVMVKRRDLWMLTNCKTCEQ